MRIRSGESSESHRTYAPRSSPDAGARSLGRASAPSAATARADRAVRALERDLPRVRRLVRVGGADEPEVRDRTQRRVRLDGLVGRPVLAEADRVVRPRPDDRQAHQRGEPDRRAHVVAEHEKGRAVRLHAAAMHCNAVHDRAHRVLADAERDVAAGPQRREQPAAFEVRVRRFDEVAGAADHRGNRRRERLHDLPAGGTRGELLAGLELRQLPLADAARPGGVPPLARRPGTRPTSRQSGVPFVFELRAALGAVHMRVDLVRHVEVLVGVPAERLLRRRDLLGAERAAVRLRGVDRVRRTERDVAADDDHRRTRGLRLRRGDRRAQGVEVVDVRRAARASRAPRSARRRSSVNEIDVVPSIVMWLSS